jgi:hypothetical protein
MDIIRGIGKFIGGSLFTLGLSVFIIILTMMQFTEYDTVKPLFVPLIENQLSNQTNSSDWPMVHTSLVTQCEGKENIQLPLGNDNITLKCSDIASSSSDRLVKLIAVVAFDKVYYKEYACGFIDCIRNMDIQNLYIIFSYKGLQFYRSALVYAVVTTVVGLLVLTVSSKGWGRLTSVGSICLVSGLSFIVLPFIKNIAPRADISPIVNKLFELLSAKYVVILAIGVVLLAVGVAGKYLIKRNKKAETQ